MLNKSTNVNSHNLKQRLGLKVICLENKGHISKSHVNIALGVNLPSKFHIFHHVPVIFLYV